MARRRLAAVMPLLAAALLAAGAATAEPTAAAGAAGARGKHAPWRPPVYNTSATCWSVGWVWVKGGLVHTILGGWVGRGGGELGRFERVWCGVRVMPVGPALNGPNQPIDRPTD